MFVAVRWKFKGCACFIGKTVVNGRLMLIELGERRGEKVK